MRSSSFSFLSESIASLFIPAMSAVPFLKIFPSVHDEALTRVPVVFHDATKSRLVAIKFDWCEFLVQFGFPGYYVNG